MLSTWLRLHSYSVDTCPDSAQALVVFETKPPDAVLLDLHMPRIAGTEIFAVMHRAQPKMPIIIVTGDDDAELGRILLDCGAFDYAPGVMRFAGLPSSPLTSSSWNAYCGTVLPSRQMTTARRVLITSSSSL